MRTLNEITPVGRDATLSVQHAAGVLPGSKDGKGIGDLADDATVAGWTENFLAGQSSDTDAKTQETAFRFGVRAEGRYAGQSFVEAESELRSEWSSEKGQSTPWDRVRAAVWAGFDRARDRRG
jgi:hypothetical protein